MLVGGSIDVENVHDINNARPWVYYIKLYIVYI